jgi:hypothetical protein
MGCFDVECAATRVAIHHGDPVYIIYWGPWESATGEKYWPRSRSTYDAVSTIRQQNSILIDDDDGWDFMSKGIKGYRGVYNDYGWYETTLWGEEGGDRPEFPLNSELDPLCYLHEWIARFLCEQQGVSFDDPVDERFVIQAIARSAYMARIQLFSPNHFLGMQYYDIEEVQLQLKIINRTEEFLKKRLEEISEEYEEDNEL